MTSTPETELTPETEPTPETKLTPAPIDPAVAQQLALAALHEITPAATVGDLRDSSVDDDGVLSIRFENRMLGYPGWYWTVGLAQVEDAAPTVLEVELLPGDGSLTAPDWLPWAERLAEYHATQAALAAEGLATDDVMIDDVMIDDDEDDDEDDEDDDLDDADAADFDDDASPILHSGDVDGVDIDELSDDADSEEDDSDDDDDLDDGADSDEDD